MPRDPRVEKLQRMRTERMTRPAGAYYGTRVTSYGAVPSGPRKRNAGRTLLSLVIFVVIMGVVLYGGAQYVLTGYRPTAAAHDRTVIVYITPGESKSAIATDLERDGVIANATIFYWYLRIFGNNIQPGQHILHTGMTMQEALQGIETPPRSNAGLYAHVTITIQDGWRAEQVAGALSQAGIASYTSVMQLIRHGIFSYSFLAHRPPGATLEGYLLPDTYQFYTHRGARYAITLMLDNFQAKVWKGIPHLQARAQQLYGNLYGALTLASIVQREAGTNHDRYLIASVFLNRLYDRSGQFTHLDTDPTVQYILGQPGNWWPQITQGDIARTAGNPYNTYHHPGLPPGPIAEPNIASITAALNPASTRYFYFHHINGSLGKSIFCTAVQGPDCTTPPQ